MKRPSLFTGAWIGGLITVPLLAIFYAADTLASTSFPPFVLFDWLGRTLPGGVLTHGIDLLVRIIHALRFGNTDTAAKAAEHAMAIALFLLGGIFMGAIAFSIFRFRPRSSRWIGIGLGLLFALPLAIIVWQQPDATHPAAAGIAIVSLGLGLWGIALGWIYERLTAFAQATSAPAGAVEPMAAERINRRQFLVRIGGATALITVVGASVGVLSGRRDIPSGERWSKTNRLPNAQARVKPVDGTRPEFTPLEKHYRIDIASMPPRLDPHTWRLRIGGLVARPLTLSLDDLRRYDPLHQFVTLLCISNPVGGDLTSTTRWTGASLRRLLDDWHLAPGATHLKISAADGFFEYVPLDDIRRDDRVMLTYAWDGVPLPESHGFPLRIYLPDRYGMKQPKWITAIEATDHWEEGYWVERGWDREARMKATSVIDTVRTIETDSVQREKHIAVGGIAHAGARGISRVEVRLDDGGWTPAALRDPLSPTTWVIWRSEMPFAPGEHRFTVRCFDGAGAPQITEPAEPHPSGASGLHERRAHIG